MTDRIIRIVGFIGLILTASAVAAQEGGAIPARQTFEVAGREAFVIMPERRGQGPTPWVLYAPTLSRQYPGDAEAWMFGRFLDAGLAIAGVDVGESYGSPAGRAVYDALHERLVKERGFDSRASLLARSRGGLMLYAWAAENPRKVRCIAGIYPVCDLRSYPGLARACGAYGMTEAELVARLAEHNPVDRLAGLAAAKVPIFHIHGDDDRVVPLKENSATVAERYRAMGGPMELMIAAGQGHNMWEGFFRCEALAAFVIRHATAGEAAAAPKPIAHWTLDDADGTARDAAGGHHGVVVGATSVEGRVGKAMLFDRAKGDHVRIDYSPDFELHTFTVAAWVKLTKPPTFSGILGTRFGGEHTFDMKVNADKVHGDIGDGQRWIETKVNFYEKDTGSNGQGGKLPVGPWYHITFVVDDETKQCRVYLDGDLKARIGYEGRAALMRPGQSMHLGHSSGTEHMDGAIDDVRIWGRALTEQQILSVMRAE